jgi:hypothetical protein
MASYKGWNHDEEEKNRKGEHDEEVWIEAYKYVYA